MKGVRRSLLCDGVAKTATAEADVPLLEVARAQLDMRRLIRGCEDGRCGACRALLDGALVATCRVPWEAVPEGATIASAASVEGTPAVARVLGAFESERPTRCRMCVGGLAVTAAALERQGASPENVEALLEGATCSCTGRGSWRRALGAVSMESPTPANLSVRGRQGRRPS